MSEGEFQEWVKSVSPSHYLSLAALLSSNRIEVRRIPNMEDDSSKRTALLEFFREWKKRHGDNARERFAAGLRTIGLNEQANHILNDHILDKATNGKYLNRLNVNCILSL